ncbi:hypothetical protein LZ32DRAFT_622791 [Colletotrichum eremochloae]|nr:hypothetical protein LZ32DRAFT_622791 [Colletotrichum eremochloae]
MDDWDHLPLSCFSHRYSWSAHRKSKQALLHIAYMKAASSILDKLCINNKLLYRVRRVRIRWLAWNLGAHHLVSSSDMSRPDFGHHLARLVYEGACPTSKAWGVYWVFFVDKKLMYCYMLGVSSYGWPLIRETATDCPNIVRLTPVFSSSTSRPLLMDAPIGSLIV